MHIGGEKRMVWPQRPPLPSSRPRSLQRFDDLRAFGLGRFFRRAVFHQFDAEHQTFAADVADDVVFFLQLLEAGEDVVADLERVRLEVFAVDHFEDGLALRADDRVAAEGVEVNSLARGPRRSSAW